VVVAFYVLAKLLETFDRQIFALGHIASGHTLKHIMGGVSGILDCENAGDKTPGAEDLRKLGSSQLCG
jgi:hypothetical protein